MSPKELEFIMLTVSLPASVTTNLTMDSAARYLDIPIDSMDPTFGVVAVDSARKLYAVMVTEAEAVRLCGSHRPKIAGPFADPKIAPFGPENDESNGI